MLPVIQHSQCHSQQANELQFCGDLNSQYFQLHHQWYARVISWSRLKHLVSYKTPCAANEQGTRGSHQSPAYKPSYTFNFLMRMRYYNINVEYTVYAKYYLTTSERKVNRWYVGTTRLSRYQIKTYCTLLSYFHKTENVFYTFTAENIRQFPPTKRINDGY